MVDFEYYSQTYHGSLGQVEFSSLLPKVCDFIKVFMESYISIYKQKESLEEYDCNLDKAVCYQIDCIALNGGDKALNGNGDNNVTSVTTSGLTYHIGDDRCSFNGVPLSPMAKQMIMAELDKKGYLNRCVR